MVENFLGKKNVNRSFFSSQDFQLKKQRTLFIYRFSLEGVLTTEAYQ